jgi:GWxTD domain-containing protein
MAVAVAAGAAGAVHSGHGDFTFYLDAASFRGHDGKDLACVSVRVSNQDLKFKDDGPGWSGRVHLSLLVTDDTGAEVVKTSETVTCHETDPSRVESPVAYQTIVKQFSLPPGGYWLSCGLEDLNAPKISMVGLSRGANKSAAVHRTRLALPEMPEDEPSFSDAMFVWDIDPSGAGVRRYRPNPSRIYGLYRDTLTVYMELYLPADLAEASTFDFRSEIASTRGDPVRVTPVTLLNPAGGGGASKTYPIVIREDLTAVEAGTYTLYFQFGLDGNTVKRVRAGDFSVAWDLRTWETPRREYLAEARFLLGDDDFKRFRNETPGDQERLLDARWKQFDSDPSTEVNEAYDVFIERLDYINAHYAEGGPAIVTDRGDIYLRYGPPDEFVQDVIPMNYETLAEAEAVIDNPYHPLNLSSTGSKLYSTPVTKNTFGASPRTSGRYRPEDNTGVPYELWIYHRGGDPILGRDRVKEMDPGMRFLFVDRDGHGRYQLERSSSISIK